MIHEIPEFNEFVQVFVFGRSNTATSGFNSTLKKEMTKMSRSLEKSNYNKCVKSFLSFLMDKILHGFLESFPLL